jgi:hypothetical protein
MQQPIKREAVLTPTQKVPVSDFFANKDGGSLGDPKKSRRGSTATRAVCFTSQRGSAVASPRMVRTTRTNVSTTMDLIK